MTNIENAARLIAAADGLLITAGAGMGVDSGLPDFRGPEGFWEAYPGMKQQGIRFSDVARPAAFHSTPELAWGFYGHRLALYRGTKPHAGFAMLLDMADRLRRGAFVFTSNVDGHFQKSGFAPDRVFECHGSLHHLQCLENCRDHIWPADAIEPRVDEKECRLLSSLPTCPDCGGLARPNVLLFGDGGWNSARMEEQQARLVEWLETVERLVVIEVGAGTNIPTVRALGESLACPLIRVNPDQSEALPKGGIALPLGALEGITLVRKSLVARGFVAP